MAPRITYRRKNTYNTKSNKIRKVKTPGSKIVAQYIKKKGGFVKCGEPGCGAKLTGIKQCRSFAASNLPKRCRTVSRAYGGNLCAKCVKKRIIRAFLIEEVKIVKKVKRPEDHTSELNPLGHPVCRLLFEKKNISSYLLFPTHPHDITHKREHQDSIIQDHQTHPLPMYIHNTYTTPI